MFGRCWNALMMRCVGLLALLAAVVHAQSLDSTLELSAYSVRCTLPFAAAAGRSGAVRSGVWSLTNYSTSDIYSFELAVPAIAEQSPQPNAVSVRYGDSGYVLIAVVPTFLGTQEVIRRVLEVHQIRRERGAAPPVLMTYNAQRMMGLVPAEEVALELRDTVRHDSIFTLLTVGSRGRDLVVLILRSRINPRTAGSWSSDLYTRILASMRIDGLFAHDTTHLVNPTGWRLAVPACWTNKVLTRLGTMPFVPERLDDDTVWNTAVVQLPAVQIEYFVTAVNLSDTALVDYAEHVARRQALEPVAAYSRLQWQGVRGYWYRALTVRRGDVVQTTYGVFPLRGKLGVVRLTAWQRDMPLVDNVLDQILAAWQLRL